MMINFKTLNKGKASPKEIEAQFENLRAKYLGDIEKIRRKYAAKMIELSNDYNIACAAQK